MTKLLQRCPICAKRTDPKLNCYPFCSERCRTQDLANWSTEAYAVSSPITEADENFDSVDSSPESEDYA